MFAAGEANTTEGVVVNNDRRELLTTTTEVSCAKLLVIHGISSEEFSLAVSSSIWGEKLISQYTAGIKSKRQS